MLGSPSVLLRDSWLPRQNSCSPVYDSQIIMIFGPGETFRFCGKEIWIMKFR
jgi:hypothetical protein